MSKKILLLSSVIFLSSCATTNISELGDKFLDLINPSDDATEVAMLSGEETLVAMDQTGGFTIDELEALSNDELIAIAKEKGLEDLILLDEDGNLLNRDQVTENSSDGRTYKLQISDSDGYNPQTVVRSSNPILSPAWSRDQKKLAYVSFKNNRSEVFVMTPFMKTVPIKLPKFLRKTEEYCWYSWTDLANINDGSLPTVGITAWHPW